MPSRTKGTAAGTISAYMCTARCRIRATQRAAEAARTVAHRGCARITTRRRLRNGHARDEAGSGIDAQGAPPRERGNFSTLPGARAAPDKLVAEALPEQASGGHLTSGRAVLRHTRRTSLAGESPAPGCHDLFRSEELVHRGSASSPSSLGSPLGWGGCAEVNPTVGSAGNPSQSALHGLDRCGAQEQPQGARWFRVADGGTLRRAEVTGPGARRDQRSPSMPRAVGPPGGIQDDPRGRYPRVAQPRRH